MAVDCRKRHQCDGKQCDIHRSPSSSGRATLLSHRFALKELKLLWLACGNKDGLIRISQGLHAYLKEKGVPHVWHVDGYAHDPTEWKNNLYLFVQHIFR